MISSNKIKNISKINKKLIPIINNSKIRTVIKNKEKDKKIEMMSFTSLGLSENIVSILNASGYKTPTLVQQQAIPAGIAGRDLLVSSPTGSGKTAAFMLPAIERFSNLEKNKISLKSSKISNSNNIVKERWRRRPQIIAQPILLVLTPTRELAMQVTNAALTYGKHLRKLKTISILGGVSYTQQLTLLSKNPEIVVATPGRLIDHIERNRINLSYLKILVLDEADRMLDMGFIEDIETIVASTPSTRQTMLFSATLDGAIGSLTKQMLKNPERIEIKHSVESKSNITQIIHYIDDQFHKDKIMNYLLKNNNINQAIIFTATKIDADKLSGKLSDSGFEASALHGDLPQGIRNRTIKALREQRIKILVATDVAARGIDIPGITHVFNYDLPKFAEDYIHRIGRTGRAGRKGTAISLVHYTEQNILKKIERFVRTTFTVSTITGLEPSKIPMSNRKSTYANRKKNGYSKYNTNNRQSIRYMRKNNTLFNKKENDLRNNYNIPSRSSKFIKNTNKEVKKEYSNLNNTRNEKYNNIRNNFSRNVVRNPRRYI